jgi:CYTH domain-containing protein
MGIEIERKFLMSQDFSIEKYNIIRTIVIEQGYLHSDQMQAIRIRTSRTIEANRGYITIKNSYGKNGIGVAEYEYEIPYEDAEEMLLTCTRTISKTRYEVPLHGCENILEVDIFNGRHSGLIVAEVEFKDEDEANSFDVPSFALKEVTYDPRFKNSELVKMNSNEAAQLIKEIYA